MLGDTAGFVILKSDADCKHAMGDPKEWTKGIKLALEINNDTDSVLLIDGANMSMFDFKDVDRKFECYRQGDVLMPLGLNEIEKMVYFGTVMSRNGGYNNMTMRMVMAQSLHSQEFSDSVLWMKGQDPENVATIQSLKKVAKERLEATAKNKAEARKNRKHEREQQEKEG